MREVLDANIFDEGAPCREALMSGASWFTLACVAVGAAGSVPLGLAGYLPASGSNLGTFMLVLCVGSLVAMPIHELIHGAFFKLLGARGTKVTFGYQKGMLYAGCPGTRYTPARFTAILLAPLVVLTCVFVILGFALPFSWAPMAALWLIVLHAAGCVGDLYFALLIRRHPEATLCEDTDKGMRLLAEE